MGEIIREIQKIAAKYDNIHKVVLFGSRARGDNDARSDIDIAIYPQKIPFECEAGFWVDIEDIDTLLKFDIVIINKELNPELVKEIEAEGVIIYEKGKTEIRKQS